MVTVLVAMGNFGTGRTWAKGSEAQSELRNFYTINSAYTHRNYLCFGDDVLRRNVSPGLM